GAEGPSWTTPKGGWQPKASVFGEREVKNQKEGRSRDRPFCFARAWIGSARGPYAAISPVVAPTRVP
ncbi:MAG TPA: hypothetical protein PKD41_14915, partial [Solidesulfovibrio sp.]|nr:hypothetical protein [Solidesulfovibrio sp.]